MKFHEVVNEGRVEPNVILSIENIVNRGKATNLFELVMLSRCLQMLKAGTLWQQANFWDPNLSTSMDMMAALKTLPEAKIVEAAAQVLAVLRSKDAADGMMFTSPEPNYLTWLNTLRRAEAND